MTLLDKIKSLSSYSPCLINILRHIQPPPLSYYSVVGVIRTSLRRDQPNMEIAFTGPSGHGKSFLARRGMSSFWSIHIYLLCEPNSSSGLSSQYPDAYRECNDLTIHTRPVGFMFNELL